jgi:hypothetical protein
VFTAQAFDAKTRAVEKGSRVYLGALYVGKTPFELKLPDDMYQYLTVITDKGNMGSAVYYDNNLIRGNGRIRKTTNAEKGANDVSMRIRTAPPVDPAERRVDRGRKYFYATYGALWVILPISLVMAGVAGGYFNAAVQSVANYDNSMVDPANRWARVQVGMYIGIGAAVVGVISGIIRYLVVSRADAMPLAHWQKAADMPKGKKAAKKAAADDAEKEKK